MTDKSWLIRTKSNQILGPVSKEKLMEFLDKGALNADDEVSSGNGYWFWIKEADLVARYLRGDIPQTFNPISEAKDVITSSLTENKTASISRIPSHQPKQNKEQSLTQKSLPDQNDLELPDPMDLDLPDMAPTKSESAPKNTKPPVASASPVDPPGEGDNIKFPEADELEFPDDGKAPKSVAEEEAGESTDPMMVMPIEIDLEETVDEEVAIDDVLGASQEFEGLKEDDVEVDEAEDTNPTLPKGSVKKKAEVSPPKAPSPSKKANSEKPAKRKSRIVQTPVRNDNYLRYLLVVLVLMIVGVLYYYFEILNRPISEVSKIFINSAVAQEINPVIKKKVPLIHPNSF
ncbi:MAG: hypothetical protein COW00_09085 [Bdellovibrio sp. CG12_big_fil_rev_8_21_14_0_65_39_13]|nr:MAG: hypothetical protein COW78_09155 [Bdellovibrio sp. CG22_combo_CG10-13_8_21_14_all_39_27]PIQ59778.1 MAG: hypothetical protein COW00_09085 [Bdellovibrio sp. CG12_big_fil_rev_8_21_14_0_65_39_13]PIR36194.1 MAG: hypothetical protein COV37_04305 [Bdellovibrio sp. CG11_big_fil_rev_8_21_14_0_20_39_38]